MNRLFSGRQGQTRSAPFLFIGLLVLIIIAGAVGLFVGVKGLCWRQLPEIMSLDSSNLLVYKVWFVRLPRVVLAIIVGAGLAIAGCLLQGITRNPLSDPELMGINQGASFLVVLSLSIFGLEDVTVTILIAAIIGAAVGGGIVYTLSGLAGYTPTRLVLAGVSVSLFMAAMTTGLIILQDDKLSEILYWMAGKLSGTTWTDVQLSTISIVPGALASLFLANQFNVFSLGEDAARGLGQNVTRVRRTAFLLVILLVGVLIPMSAVAGASLLLLADVGGQWVLYPTDTPVGIITALLGTPFFLYLMRRKMEGS